MIGTSAIPDLTILAEKSWEELRKLTFTQMKWSSFGIDALGFTLSDDETCKAGANDFTNSHTFDPSKKITSVETIISKKEEYI